MKSRCMLSKTIITSLILLFFSTLAFSQRGQISGVLYDETGYEMIGAEVGIKGTDVRTLTDFDGSYTLPCEVGDIIEVSYVGYDDKEIIVTKEMFVDKSTEIAVQKISTPAYINAVEKIKGKTNLSPITVLYKLESINKNLSDYHKTLDRVKKIKIEPDFAFIELTYFKKDNRFEVGFNTSFGVRTIQKNNLPILQKTFSQGTSVDGFLQFQDGQSGNPFSFGPEINNLEFDGNQYDYDENGKLVSKGNGNGNPAITYDNSLFENVLTSSNNLYFDISNSNEKIAFNFSNKSAKDIFGREKNANNYLNLSYSKERGENKIGWKVLTTFYNIKDNQPNINGFLNNVLLNNWATPPTFSNQQGILLNDNSQRSFHPNFDNPEWLLRLNQNANNIQNFVSSIQNDIAFDKIILESKLSFSNDNNRQNFGLPLGISAFETGYLSSKDIQKRNFDANLNFSYDDYTLPKSELIVKSKLNFNYDDLEYSLEESNGFENINFLNPETFNEVKVKKNRNRLRWLNRVEYGIFNRFKIVLTNNSYISSIQKDKLFLPSVYAKIDLSGLFNIQYHPVKRWGISASFSKDVNDISLYYSSLSHNSLLFSASESSNYLANNDLFIDSSIGLEEKESFNANLSFEFSPYDNRLFFDLSYFNELTKGSVFPVLKNESFQLQNIADIRNQGVEFYISSQLRIGGKVNLEPKVSFSYYRPKVEKLLNSETEVPIAGFSDVSRNLIVGEPVGVIVGSAYLRDSQGRMIIGNNGFPLVNTNPQIIGNPTPDFNIVFSNKLKVDNFEINFSIDYRKGGDVWNGTQSTLDYFGTSQHSASERTVENFIFEGVNEQGEINSVAVDFYNPANAFVDNKLVRYGFGGVGEDAIEDGTYLNLRSLQVAYSFFKDDYYRRNTFFRGLKLGIYAKNFLTISKFEGHTLEGTLYGNQLGQGLNFFNQPLQSEFGVTLNVKI